MMIDSVEEPEHSDDYFIRPRGPQDDSIANGRWKAFPILSKCRQVGNSFNDCRWSWIPRTTNMAPDRLASQRCVKMCDFHWIDRTHLHLFMYLIKMDYLAHISFIRKCKG
ncbi:hypothetical protein DVH24_026462 [Malus domestica]|uniref:Uncharacterized protein n=1 Tax=Malus domestica TaxID=3750 RepID=A0A498KIT4_MALDO|nr:hypothetical protein DVH24_026462 [Malus domestica]